MSTKKYELVTTDTKTNWDGKTLYRIRRISNGELGGYIESEKNLSQVSGNAWVYGDARVSGNAQVSSSFEIMHIPTGLKWSVTMTRQNVSIGCHLKTYKEWISLNEADAKQYGLDGTAFKHYKLLLKRLRKIMWMQNPKWKEQSVAKPAKQTTVASASNLTMDQL